MRNEAAYTEGDWFAVPLREGGGYCVGRITRDAGRGTLLGHFFGPRRAKVPTLKDVVGLKVGDADAIQWFGDLSLIEGDWPILGHTSWRRDDWPIPAFGRYDDVLGVGLRFEYDDPDLSEPVKQERVTREEAESLPREGLLGAGAVELVLTDLVST